MVSACQSCAAECWKVLDDITMCVTDMHLIDLMNKIHYCVMEVVKAIVSFFLFYMNSSIMILGIMIAFSTPETMEPVVHSIEKLASSLILHKEVWQITSLIVGGCFAFSFTAAAIAFYIGANKGAYLRKLTTTAPQV